MPELNSSDDTGVGGVLCCVFGCDDFLFYREDHCTDVHIVLDRIRQAGSAIEENRVPKCGWKEALSESGKQYNKGIKTQKIPPIRKNTATKEEIATPKPTEIQARLTMSVDRLKRAKLDKPL